MIDFKVPKNKDKIIIDTNDWIRNSTGNTLNIYRISGKDLPTYITKVVDVNIQTKELKNSVKKGDTVVLTRVASEISEYYVSSLSKYDKGKYCSIPVMQVLGVFEGDTISYNSLRMLFDKILIKKISQEAEILLSENNAMVGEVVRIGTNKFSKDWKAESLSVKVGDKVLIRDNVVTELRLDGDIYYAVEEGMIAAILNHDTLEESEIISNSVIMEPYLSETIGSSVLITPSLNYEDEDITSIYNRDLFKVVAVDKNLIKLKKGDIILVDRNVTNYVYFREHKYFILSSLDFVEGKVRREENYGRKN